MKFRLATSAATRAVRELSLGKGTPLSSTYFDTRDRLLSGGRAALRLRRAGRIWLQAFKCEQGPATRGEWELPAPRDRLEVRRFPLGEIREASGIDLSALRLHPLFETRFTRQAASVHIDGAIIEIALDRGHVLAGRRRERIHELEIELKSGSLQSMLRHAESLVEPLRLQLAFDSKAARGYRLARGEKAAPPRKWQRPNVAGRTPAEAFAQLAGAAIEQAGANAAGVLASNDPEYLHQLRVGFRRLRALLVAFRALGPRTESLKRRLRAFSRVLGDARDWDVVAPASPQAAKARAAARALVASPAFNAALLRCLRWIEEAPWHTHGQPLAPFAGAALERLQGKALKAAKHIDWLDAGERHALRIRVKRLRYACDAFADCFPAEAVRPYLGALEALQDHLGALNDIAVARRLMPELKSSARERRLIPRVQRDWKAFERRRPFWRAGK
ncbi:MAG TPA: CHAD domain-containing protein [Burkholderiales bacterium]|nr:CHAD domain-containing protein [Burkholderiales bacterium]